MVLPADFPYTTESGNQAETAAMAILESRGNTPRLYRNTLVFLAADKVRLQDLDEAVLTQLIYRCVCIQKPYLIDYRRLLDYDELASIS